MTQTSQLGEQQVRIILEKQRYFTNLPSKVSCQDRGKRGGKCEYCRDGNWFTCDLCGGTHPEGNRSVPYCFGCGHEVLVHSEYCDSCYLEAIKLQEVAA